MLTEKWRSNLSLCSLTKKKGWSEARSRRRSRILVCSRAMAICDGQHRVNNAFEHRPSEQEHLSSYDRLQLMRRCMSRSRICRDTT